LPKAILEHVAWASRNRENDVSSIEMEVTALQANFKQAEAAPYKQKSSFGDIDQVVHRISKY
jgi:hypothetical protein